MLDCSTSITKAFEILQTCTKPKKSHRIWQHEYIKKSTCYRTFCLPERKQACPELLHISGNLMLCKDMNSKAIYHDYHTTSLLLLLLFSVGQHAASQNHGTRGLAPRGSSPRSTARTCSANGGHLPSHGNTPKSSQSHCRQTSDISPTKSKNLNVSRLVLQMSLPNPLKPDVKPASNHFGCICEQIRNEQCCMKVYIAINCTKWYCSKLCIKLVITMKNFFYIRYAT